MNIIVCLDPANGISFNHRRQSRDSEVIKRVLKLSENSNLFVSEYSAPLFKDTHAIVDNNLLNTAQDGDYCFVEDMDVFTALNKIEKLIIFRWDKKYPSDKKFPIIAVTDKKQLISTEDFVGSSHDKITEEVYR